MFDAQSYYNSKEIIFTDFYSPNPPSPNPIHPSPINLSGGRPNAGFYPLNSIDLHLKAAPFSQKTKETAVIPFEEESTLDITRSLQYGPPQGLPELLNFINLIAQFHGVDATSNDVFDSLITSGSGDSLNKILGSLLDEGDTVLVEEYTYTPVFSTFKYHGGVMIPFGIDFQNEENHIDTVKLESLLENWDESKQGKFPKFLFTVTTQNPSGLITNSNLIGKIVDICKKFNLLIIEDDPDGFIRHLTPKTEQFPNYIESLHNSSYLSTKSPRVIHLGTFSKTIFPGIRLGFIIAHKSFIERFTTLSKIITKAPSGLSQLILCNLVKAKSTNGDSLFEGYLNWTFQLSKTYTKRVKTLFDTLYKTESFKRELLVPIIPQGGMFLIFKTPGIKGPKQLEILRYKFVKHGVLVILGNLMSFEDEARDNADFIRLTLSNAFEQDGEEVIEELVEGVKRLDRGILEYYDQTA